MDQREKKRKQNAAALLPILVFLALYLGMGLIFEYRLGIEMAFYNIPIVVVFMVSLLRRSAFCSILCCSIWSTRRL